MLKSPLMQSCFYAAWNAHRKAVLTSAIGSVNRSLILNLAPMVDYIYEIPSLPFNY
jgi:hypothetical protein